MNVFWNGHKMELIAAGSFYGPERYETHQIHDDCYWLHYPLKKGQENLNDCLDCRCVWDLNWDGSHRLRMGIWELSVKPNPLPGR